MKANVVKELNYQDLHNKLHPITRLHLIKRSLFKHLSRSIKLIKLPTLEQICQYLIVIEPKNYETLSTV